MNVQEAANMTSEDQEMMARISHLAGQINRHKNQQAGVGSVPGFHPYHRNGNTIGYQSRGHRGASTPVHRHKSLVLNGIDARKTIDLDSSTTSDVSNLSRGAWVAKNDRHRQLINSAVYKKDVQTRSRALEQTRINKEAMQDARERDQVMNHFIRAAGRGKPGDGRSFLNKHELVIQDIRFVATKDGSKLVKLSGDGNAAKTTPRVTYVGGVKFYRTKNGNLYRHGIIKAQRRSGVVKKTNVPCKMFSATGSCTQGPRCRYMHDPSKVAACKDFLLRGECVNGPDCDLSHEMTPNRTPTCLHFARDSCTKADCRYAHVKVIPGAPVCRLFGLYGFCDRGAECTERHAFECPDFANTGVCNTPGCKLPHRERASMLRNCQGSGALHTNGEEGITDVSSDDGESIDEYDVDSDEVDEFIGQDEVPGSDFRDQHDFIEL